MNNGRNYIIFFKQSGFKIFKSFGEFGHVFIICKDNNNIWVGIDPSVDGLVISSISDDQVTFFKESFIHVELTNYNGYKHQLGLTMLKTCVGLVKATLGISNPFIWTPKQLYKYLRKINNGDV